MYAPKLLATSNVEFVKRVKHIVAEMGKSIATPDEARAILGLNRQESPEYDTNNFQLLNKPSVALAKALHRGFF